MRTSMLTMLCIFLFASCAVEPQPIRFGEDMCHFCTMTIVERGFGTEVVTSKGKAYKFDSLECMLHHMNRQDDETIALYLTSLLPSPGDLHDATSAVYVHSMAIPSPMGGFLSAFSDRASAQQVLGDEAGDIYDWEGLQTYFYALEE